MQNVVTTSVESAGFPSGLVRIDYTSDYDGTGDYCMALPPREGSDWVVCLHGHNGHGNQIFVRKDIKQSWLPAFQRRGLGIFSPNLRDNAWMNPAAEYDLHELLAYLRSEYGAQRFIFTSGSMGATGSLIYACHHPEDVLGLDLHGAVCGMEQYYWFCRAGNLPMHAEIADAIQQAYNGTPDEQPELYASCSAINYAGVLARMPFFLIHGSLDRFMPVAQSRQLACALSKSASFVYMEVPGGDHDAPLHLEDDLIPGYPSPLDWILK